MKALRISDVMTRRVVVAPVDATYKELVELMLNAGVSGLPVVDGTGAVVGVVTEGDLVRRQGFAHASGHRALRLLAHLLTDKEPYVVRRCDGVIAEDLMTQPVVHVAPEDDLATAARLLTRHGVNRLPVLAERQLVGIVSRADLLRSFDRPDEDIHADVVSVLGDPIQTPEDVDAAITVSEGIVSLQGSARVPSDIPVVTAVVSRIPGVVDVRNHLTARQAEPTTKELNIPLVP